MAGRIAPPRRPAATARRPPKDRRPQNTAVTVISRRRIRGVRTAEVRRDASRLLELLACDGELNVVLVGDAEMRRLNATYRQADRPTDVLAFAMREGDGAALHPQVLGDVVISLDTAARQAAARAAEVSHEVRLLLAHGILHLLGYDHERSPADARRMFTRQRALLRALGSGEVPPPQARRGRAYGPPKGGPYRR